MITTLTRAPSFRPTQCVRFEGGEGIVRDFKSESGNWTYLAEMALGTEPPFGRVGAETMIVLNETDVLAAYTQDTITPLTGCSLLESVAR